jgi:hypothetical protein
MSVPTNELTIHQLVDTITQACVDQGIDVAPKDVGFIIQSFIEGMFVHHTEPPLHPAAIAAFQVIADECGNIKNE